MVEAFSLMHKVLALCCSRFNVKLTSLFGTVSMEMRQHVNMFLDFLCVLVLIRYHDMYKTRIACYSHRMC